MFDVSSVNSWEEFTFSLEELDNNEKGLAFEELTKLHLLSDPVFQTKILEVWHHSEVPQKVVDELGLQRPEIGVDLIALTKDGSYWAIQCKYHGDNTKNVTYDELSTFFSITEREQTYNKLSHRIVSTSADGVSHKVGKAHQQKLGYLTSQEFKVLGQQEFDQFRKLVDGRPLEIEPRSPRYHQSKAIRKCENFFAGNANSRGKVVHPCGSGKSLTGYWLAGALRANSILITVPSLALVRQTLGVWARESVANSQELDWMAVCSDTGVSSSDDPAMQAIDLGIEVNTDPDLIANFLSRGSEATKVLITTYQSGRVVSQGAQIANFSFDLGIFDEAHKTVGRRDKTFAHLVFDENISVSKRIFMTATEREFKGDSDDIVSMDDSDVYGPLIDHMSFRQALEQEPPILCDYKIITTVVTQREIQQLIDSNEFVKTNGKEWSIEADASMIASLIAIEKAVNGQGINHGISFHSSIAKAKEFQNLVSQAAEYEHFSSNLRSFHISGKFNTGERAAELERFLNCSPSVITNARCLTEGVDIPAIDAVLFADPKQSKVDIVQAAGRAMRVHDGKALGYILLPVVLEELDNSNIDSLFSQIITVISALGMSDERIVDEFKSLISDKKRLKGRIVEIDLPESISKIDIDEFISSIEIRVWDRLSFAKSVVGEGEFAKWMKQNTQLSDKSIKNYSQAIRKISNDLVKLKLAYSSLEEIMESEDLDRLKKDYFQIAEYKELDVRGKGMYSAGFNKLIEFHRATHSAF